MTNGPTRTYKVFARLTVTVSEAHLEECFEDGMELDAVLYDTVRHALENDSEVTLRALIKQQGEGEADAPQQRK